MVTIKTEIERLQAEAERFRDGMPAVFHRKNRRPWLVTMRREDFMKLYRREE